MRQGGTTGNIGPRPLVRGKGYEGLASGAPWYTFPMSTLLEQVVKDLRSLSREEQDRAAEVLLAFLGGLQEDFRLMV
jgi:hypothetical protein